jgi:ATP-binding cassette subfamily B protein
MSKNTPKTNSVLLYYWRHACKYPKLVIGTAISIPMTILVNNYLPALILAHVLSELSQHHYKAHQVWASFGPDLLAYAGLLLLGLLAWRVVDYFMWRLEANSQQDIAEEVFDNLMNESAQFHANNFSGTLVSQSNKVLTSYVRVADTTIFQTYPLVAGIIIVSFILLPRAPLFVLALVIFSISYLAVAFRLARPVQKASSAYGAAESKQTGNLADAISNVMVIKSFAHGGYERRRFHQSTALTRTKLFEFARIHQLQIVSLGVLSRTISGAALALAVVSVLVFDANIGTVFLILSYTSTIVDQLFQFSNNSLRNYNRSIGDAQAMVAQLSNKPQILDPAVPEKLKIAAGKVEFKSVEFTHDDANDAIFEKFNLNIAPGEKIGLVGHSGSGKTTFTRLLLRFSDIDGGSIEIDGQNIGKITQDDLRSTIAYVPQEPLLFHRAIAENIAYGKANATREDIVKSAKLSHAHDFIEKLPKAYDTLVGERGVKLSGGQRQRIAIARAMLKDAPILLLDEATSALDSESEVLIQDALWKLMEGRTAVVIAHRLSTIQKMDRIVVLDEGKIVEQGTHKDLLAKKGTYAKFWAHQSGGFLEDEEE